MPCSALDHALSPLDLQIGSGLENPEDSHGAWCDRELHKEAEHGEEGPLPSHDATRGVQMPVAAGFSQLFGAHDF